MEIKETFRTLGLVSSLGLATLTGCCQGYDYYEVSTMKNDGTLVTYQDMITPGMPRGDGKFEFLIQERPGEKPERTFREDIPPSLRARIQADYLSLR